MALKNIFGEDRVFYDSWSIRPGDGIISKMNAGLSAPDFVFFFVSMASLKSRMVDLEWQNALYKSTKGDCKIIPVRVDGSPMPPLISQSLYIDMYSNGLEIAKQQIVSLVQGTKGFEPSFSGFSNLTWRVEGSINSTFTIIVEASHLMEPIVSFLVLTNNEKSEIEISCNRRSPALTSFTKNIDVNGESCHAFGITPISGAITPKHPLEILVEQITETPISFRGLMHKSSGDGYSSIPTSQKFFNLKT